MEQLKPERDTTAFHVRRTIPLAKAPPEKLEQALLTLREIEWLIDVGVDDQHLRVHYDASNVNFRDIERLLDEVGLQRPTSVWWRFRSALYRYLDTNARSNALSRGGACCNRPPSAWKVNDTSESEP